VWMWPYGIRVLTDGRYQPISDHSLFRQKKIPVRGGTGNRAQHPDIAVLIDAKKRKTGSIIWKFRKVPCYFPCSLGIRGAPQ
jgi:hypothetical protein